MHNEIDFEKSFDQDLRHKYPGPLILAIILLVAKCP